MPKIVKLNYDRKVRYLFDKDTEECIRLADEVMNHYGQFLESPHGWWMEDIKRFQKVVERVRSFGQRVPSRGVCCAEENCRET